jgi:hypothetical protein
VGEPTNQLKVNMATCFMALVCDMDGINLKQKMPGKVFAGHFLSVNSSMRSAAQGGFAGGLQISKN